MISNNKASVKPVRIIEKVNDGYLVTINTEIKNHKGFARIKDKLPLNSSAKSIETDGAVFKNVDGYAKFIWSEIPKSKEKITVKYQLANKTSLDTSFILYGVYSSEKLISEGFNNGIPIDSTTYNPTSESFVDESIADNISNENIIIKKKTEDEEVDEMK